MEYKRDDGMKHYIALTKFDGTIETRKMERELAYSGAETNAPISQSLAMQSIYDTVPPMCSSTQGKRCTKQLSDETPIYLAYIEPLSPPAKHLTHTQTIKPQPH